MVRGQAHQARLRVRAGDEGAQGAWVEVAFQFFSLAFRFPDRRGRSSGRSPPVLQRVNPVNGERHMHLKTGQASAFTVRRDLLFLVVTAIALLPLMAAAQGLTGSVIGRVRDEQGAAIQGATVRLSSPALMGGPATLITNETGQLRFPVLPPGVYALEIEMRGFATLHDQDILIAAGATIERTATLKLAGVEESVVVEGTGSRIDARHPGFGNALRFRGHRRDSHATGEHVRLRQGRARRVAHLAVQRYRDDHLGVRLRNQRKPVSRRWHEHDLSVQWCRANRAWCRLHSRSTGLRGRSVG